VPRQHRSPRDAGPSPPLSGLRAEEMAPLHAPRAVLGCGEAGPRQHLSIGHAFMEHWQPLCRPAGPAFPASSMPGGFAPSQPLPSAGGRDTCRATGQWGGTEDPPGTLLPPSRREDPRHRMRRGLEPRAPEGRCRAAPVPEGQEKGTVE